MLEDSLKLSVEPHLHIMEYMQPMAIDWTCLELTEREEARESCTGSVFMRLEHLRTVESVCHWEIIPMDIREIIPKGWPEMSSHGWNSSPEHGVDLLTPPSPRPPACLEAWCWHPAQSQPPTHLTQVQDEAVPGVEAVPAQRPLGGTDVLLPLDLVELFDGCWGGPRGCLVKCRLHTTFLQPRKPA